MIPTSLKGVWQIFVDSLTIMINKRTLAVCRDRSPGNLTTVYIAYALVPQTDTKYRDFAAKIADNIIRDTCLQRSAGSRGDDDVRGTQALNFGQGYPVITIDHRFPAQFTEVLGKVINKGIVIINQDDHLTSL
jgi:hypothetical protein